MSAKTFTDRQGQFLAFIDAYTRVTGRPGRERHAAPLRDQPALRAPDGAHAGAARAHPPPAGGGAHHRGAPRPRAPARATPPRTRQILCAEELASLHPTSTSRCSITPPDGSPRRAKWPFADETFDAVACQF